MIRNQVINTSGGIKITLQMLNARTLRVSPKDSRVEVWEDDKLVCLDYYGEVSIKIGNTIEIEKQKYKIKEIKKITNSELGLGYHVYTQKLSKSSQFIMPLLGGNRKSFRWDSNFCNCFVGTEENADYGNFIYLLYRFDGSKQFTEFEAFLRKHHSFEGVLDLDDFHTVYYFNINEELMPEVVKILEGKYSTLQPVIKKRILDFHQVSKESTLGNILFKSEKRRKAMEKDLSNKTSPAEISSEAELYDMFVANDEILLDSYLIK